MSPVLVEATRFFYFKIFETSYEYILIIASSFLKFIHPNIVQRLTRVCVFFMGEQQPTEHTIQIRIVSTERFIE